MSEEACPTCGRKPEDDPADDVIAGEHGSRKLPMVRVAILESLMRGNSQPDACAEAGVHRSTFYDWLEKGRSQRARHKRGVYRDFLDEVERTESLKRTSLVKVVREAADHDPDLALQLLERMDPTNWAPKVIHLVTQDREKVLNAVFAEFEAEPQVVSRFLAAVAGVDVPGGAQNAPAKAVIEGELVSREGSGGGS